MNFDGHSTEALRGFLKSWESELLTDASGMAARAPAVIAGIKAELERRETLDRGRQAMTQNMSRAAKRRYFDD